MLLFCEFKVDFAQLSHFPELDSITFLNYFPFWEQIQTKSDNTTL